MQDSILEIQIHTGIHTGGKTTEIERLVESGKFIGIPESKWLHDYVDARDNEKVLLKIKLLEECISINEFPIFLKNIFIDRREKKTLGLTSDLHVVSMFFFKEMLTLKNPHKKNIAMDRCIVDAIYYNPKGVDKVLDEIYPFYVLTFFAKLVERYRPKHIKFIVYDKLTWDQYLIRVKRRSRGSGDIEPERMFFEKCLLSISKMAEPTMKQLKYMCGNVTEIHPTYKLNSDNVLVTIF